MKARFDPHAKYRELLAARLDRQLTRAENRVLVNHLRGCPECRQAERDYLDQRSMLRAMPRPLPPRDMWARTSTALDREVARWSYRYPRFGRPRVPVAEERRGGGASSALATAVAALGVVTVLAVMQLVPQARTLPASDGGNVAIPDAPTAPAAVASLRPTPFNVSPQRLAFVGSDANDLTVYRTNLAQVCPQDAYDCLIEEGITRLSIPFDRRVQPENIALSPDGSEMAFVGSDADGGVIAVLMLDRERPTAAPATTEPEPPTTDPTPDRATEKPDPTPTVRATRSAEATPRPTPRLSDSPAVPSPGAETPEVPPASGRPSTPEPDSTTEPTAEPSDTPAPVETPMPTLVPSPPPSAVPGLAVLSILDDVESVGAPPAWSNDGSMLAFSAMPSDGRHGPDVYVWWPGDARATAITTDHASYFASWSGRRIVLSRLADDEVQTAVIDPHTLEERGVSGPDLWLPIVDAQRTHAIAWHGRIDVRNGTPVLRAGVLYIVDWAALNPFREPEDSVDREIDLIPVDPARSPAQDPVVDWSVRWSTDGRVVGVWEGETPNAPWGRLELLGFDRERGRLDERLIDPQLARRGFAIGVDRVAWVGSTGEGADGELRIRTWGTDGVGGLRIRTIDGREIVPTF